MIKIPGALDGCRLLALMNNRLVSESQHWRFFEDLSSLFLLEINQFTISLDILPRKHLQILMKIEHPSLIMHPFTFTLTPPLIQIFFLLITPPIRTHSTMLDIPSLTPLTHTPPHLISDCLVAVTLTPPIKILRVPPKSFLPQKKILYLLINLSIFD
jgi:hypothetical protein